MCNFVNRYRGFSIHIAFKDYKSLVSHFRIANPEVPKKPIPKIRNKTQDWICNKKLDKILSCYFLF